MERRLVYVLSREFDSPLGQNSLFYETFVVPPEKKATYPPSEKYTMVHHQAVFCESGTEVFDKYEKDPIEPDYFTIYYEMVSKDTSNFFGTACRVKMGDYAREQLIKHYYSKGKTINYDGNTLDRSVSDFNSLMKVIAEDYGIDATLLKGAIYLEILDRNKINDTFKKVSSLNNQLADWLKGGIEATEKWKFTEENYDYIKYYVLPMYSNFQNKIGASGFPQQEVKYKPIIPVPFPNNQYKNMSESPHIVAAGLKNLKDFVTSFDKISTAVVYKTVQATPTIEDDVLFAVTYLVKNILEDNMPESIKNIYNKLKAVFDDLLNVVSGIENFIKAELNNEIAKINAFLCGLINGLISLVQTIIMLLAMVVEKFPIFEIEKSSPLELAKHQEELEFIEDFVDLFAKNSKEFFDGIKNLFSDGKIWREISQFFDMLKKKFIQVKDLNEYFWAYFVGGVAFELILDAIIAYFTGGSSLVAEASAKISRLTTKAEQAGAKAINFGKGLGKKVANSAKDLYKWLEKEFLDLIEAVKSGNFALYLKKKFYELIDDVEGLRKLAFGRWLNKFDKGFFNHLDGEFNTSLLERIQPSGFKYLDEFLVSQGGHRGSAILDGIIDVEKIIEPEGIYSMAQLPDDVPFKAKISIKYKDGYLVKNAESSMFPKNWDVKRIQEEIAYVYENTVAKGQGVNPASLGKKFKQYKFKDSSGRFDILIEVDDAGNIMNAYPLL
ncbi:EndoU nuclease [Chryseobacterium taichungense]|uniref:EndoU nuclease n=1 Tax=Chryseobacterium taichungense TaxID=295069 RepID=A0A1H7W0F7_9FLAO|nr:EndoU domain-containing protein [Chryseobacterium taichungense]SEM14528.1 EndoU nuclease [Chryseobacterium taichungense]